MHGGGGKYKPGKPGSEEGKVKEKEGRRRYEMKN